MKTKILQVYILLFSLILVYSCSDDDDNDYQYERPDSGMVYDVKVNIDEQTVSDLGGKDAVKSMMYTNFTLLSNSFNDSGDFNEMHFYMDDFTTFNGTSAAQIQNTTTEQDFTLLLNQNIEEGDSKDAYYADNKIVHLSSNTFGTSQLFAQTGVDNFVYAMGLFLGAFDLSAGDVDITSNPITGLGYEANGSYMNSKDLRKQWDDLSIKLIQDGNGYTSYIPSKINLSLKNLLGNPIEGMNVQVYPVRWGSGTVMSDANLSGATNSEGVITLDNPYTVPTEIKEEGEDYFANLLVKIEKDGIINHFFIPLEEVLLASLNGGGNVYDKVYSIDFTTLEDMRITHFTFDDAGNLGKNTANIVTDHNLVHTNSAKVGSGAIEFSGTTNNYLIIDDIDAGSDYSVSLWFKTSSITEDSWNHIFGMSGYSGNRSDDPWVPGGLAYGIYSSNWNYFDVGWEGAGWTGKNLIDGQWHHVTITVEYTTTERADIKKYIDGVLTTESNLSIKNPTHSSNVVPIDDFVLKIGYVASDRSQFIGQIDDVQVFNQAIPNNFAYKLFIDGN